MRTELMWFPLGTWMHHYADEPPRESWSCVYKRAWPSGVHAGDWMPGVLALHDDVHEVRVVAVGGERSFLAFAPGIVHHFKREEFLEAICATTPL